MVQNQWYHFGIGAQPILVHLSGDWDVLAVRGFDPWPTPWDTVGFRLFLPSSIWAVPLGHFVFKRTALGRRPRGWSVARCCWTHFAWRLGKWIQSDGWSPGRPASPSGCGLKLGHQKTAGLSLWLHQGNHFGYVWPTAIPTILWSNMDGPNRLRPWHLGPGDLDRLIGPASCQAARCAWCAPAKRPTKAGSDPLNGEATGSRRFSQWTLRVTHKRNPVELGPMWDHQIRVCFSAFGLLWRFWLCECEILLFVQRKPEHHASSCANRSGDLDGFGRMERAVPLRPEARSVGDSSWVLSWTVGVSCI